jgi:hypothetical protein
MRNAFKIFVGKPEGKRPLRRLGHRWEDNINMDLRETGLQGVKWIHLTQQWDQWWVLVKMVTNLWVPQKYGEFLDFRCILTASQEGLWLE